MTDYIPDYTEQFNRHEARLASELERYPECAWCGEHITTESLFDIDDMLYHPECAVECFKKDTEDYID